MLWTYYAALLNVLMLQVKKQSKKFDKIWNSVIVIMESKLSKITALLIRTVHFGQ